MSQAMMPLDAIIIENRHRSETNVDDLVESIRTVGLLHPIVVDAAGRLVAGARRLTACLRLGWTDVPVTVALSVMDATSALIAERDENTCRREMTPSEMLLLKAALEALERPKAVQRKADAGRAHGRGQIGGSNLEPPITDRKTRNAVAKGIGKSATTLDKIEKVHRTAESPETPESVRKAAVAAVIEMDRTNKVEPNYQAVKVAETTYENDPSGDTDLDRLKLLAVTAKLIHQHGAGLLALDIDHLVEVMDDELWDSLSDLAEQSAEWFANVLSRRPHGLRSMPGGKR